MTTVWGILAKSAVDNETIEEAIVRLIAAHNDDESAHLEVGQSLQSHKAAEIIDHLALSIIADKIKDGEITVAKTFDFLWNRWSIGLETVDNWYIAGAYSLYFGALEISRPSSGTGINYAYTEDYGDSVWSKDIVFRCIAVLSAITNQVAFFGVGGYNEDAESQAIGFKVVNGTLYAIHTKRVAGAIVEYTTEITGITLQSDDVYHFVYTSGSKIEFYVNNILRATHTENLPDNDYSPWHMVFLYIQNTSAQSKFLTCKGIYFAQKI